MKQLLALVVQPTLAWMGGSYDNPRAIALLLAIAQVESLCRWRRQIRGPARSFWQIEPATGLDILRTRPNAREFWQRLHLPEPTPTNVRAALEFSDTGACMIARELLWSRIKANLPQLEDDAAEEALRQYLQAWRPGRPHPDKFVEAWPLAVRHAIERP